ncbi:hypothetical protein [Pedobacter miscanthi]|uniref:Uncharacterized protein n=1 Tax=Pedobacter miscanthi TaxID=2259170 RepID=A0A366LF02_9SPHI|nr:hypothetical protein [Pedobacter miscanthi]RBQ11722.1 hypothetical protein DRW42_00115 [Pedobacter miscanthi]
MSVYQSHLELPQYGYDMVVATTEEAINATIKQYLLNYDGQEFIACYIQPDPRKQEFVPIAYDEVVKIAGMDPFSIPDSDFQNEKEKQAAQNLFDAMFAFGFKADMGLPEGFPLEDIPGIILFDEAGSQVTYNLFFKNMTMLNIEVLRGNFFLWENVSQKYTTNSSDPWVFQFRVKLDLNADNTGSVFGTLPEAVQKKVKNLNPDSAFSVQQLYLDLNTAQLTSDPVIKGVDKTSWAYHYLSVIFIQNYYETLKSGSVSPANPNGNFLLGYAIQPVSPNGASPSIIPTDLNIMISPYYDEQNKVSKEYNKYTLNYLVMSKGNRMPPSTAFIWNWVEDLKYNGVMAIKKNIFSGFLEQLLSPSLQGICLIPVVSMDVKFTKINWACYFKQDPDTVRFSLIDDNTSRVLSLDYYKEASDSDTFVPNWGNISTKVNIASDIYLESNIIRSVTTATVYIHINIEGGVTEGNVVKYKTETCYEIGVDAYGSLNAKMAPGSPAFTDLSDKINPNGWSKFVTLGEINGVIDQIQTYWSVLKEFMIGHDRAIETMLNNSGVWVFPGGKTFVFKDVVFSNFQDLTAQITYIDPEDSALFKI